MTLEFWIEVFFWFNLIKNLLTTYKDKETGIKVKRLGQISTHYLSTSFILDLIPTIPLTYFDIKFDKISDLLFLIKLLRMRDGLRFLDLRQYVSKIAKFFKERKIEKMKNDISFAEDTLNDNNNF